MKNGLLIENYHKLSKVLLNRFTLFVESPYFNKHKNTLKLHKYLLSLYPKFKDEKCEKQVVYKHIFGKDNFSLQKLKDLNSALLDLFENFLANEALKKNKPFYRQLQIQECFDNKLTKLSKKLITSSFKEIDKLEITQWNKYYYSFKLNDLAYSYQVYNGDRKTSAKHLQKSINQLDKFYFAEKMLAGSAIVNRQSVLKTDINFMFFDEITKLIEENPEYFESDYIIQLNRQLYLLQKTDDAQYYFNLKELIKSTKLNNSELRLYFSFLTNFCTKSINLGNQNFLKELFLLNNEIIKNGLLLDNGILSEWLFMNIVSVAIRVKEFDWVESFIDKYSKFLTSESYSNSYNFNSANLAYAIKDYDKAFTLLLDVEYTDVFYILNSKALLLKIYYETNEFETLDYLLSSYRLLIMRLKKIGTQKKNAYFNLIKITSALIKVRHKNYSKAEKKIALEKISKKINKMESVANKTWLIEKIELFS